MFPLTLADISLSQILEQLAPLNYLAVDEIEWLLQRRNLPLIKQRWVADDSNDTQMSDFSCMLSENSPIAFQDYYGLYPIGYGSSGVVYKAWQVNTPNIVALKKCSINENYPKERFYRELELWKRLQHSHILPLWDGGEECGNYFLVTPYVQGGSLEQLLQNTPIQRSISNVVVLLQYIIQIAQALEYAHSKNILHRDIKPGNILIQNSHAYLMDFGLAREIHTSSATRLTRGAIGTPLYIAPEIWKLQAVPQSDIYSLCVIIYEIISGSCPFYATSAEDIYLKQLLRPYPPAPHSNIPLSPKFIQFLLRGLCNLPENRYPSMTNFLSHFLAILNDSPIFGTKFELS